MQLVERGKVRISDTVVKYLPEFGQNSKEDITVRQLLTHYSGLAPDLDLQMPWQGKDTAYKMAFAEKPETTPGSGFVYSDINFIILGALVEKVSGQSLDRYTADHVFAPLKMAHRGICRREPGGRRSHLPVRRSQSHVVGGGARSDRVSHGRSRRACWDIFQRRRFEQVCANAA